MTALGVMYENGTGVVKDDQEALKWYLRAAEKGEPVAMFNLGTVYEKGIGVKKDLKMSIQWYRKAAEKGDEDAKKKLKELEKQ